MLLNVFSTGTELVISLKSILIIKASKLVEDDFDPTI